MAPWKARRIAEATLSLSAEAATFVDTQVAGFVGKVGPAQLDRLVAEAITRFMPERARQDAENAADGRHLRFHHQQVSFNGTTFLEGELDLADALDLDAAITRAAEQLSAGRLPGAPGRTPGDGRRRARPPYTVLEPGTFLWSSPHGYQFLRDHQGTLDVTCERPGRRPDRPADPPHF